MSKLRGVRGDMMDMFEDKMELIILYHLFFWILSNSF